MWTCRVTVAPSRNFFQMAASTKPLTTEAIALTEKKMDMTLGALTKCISLYASLSLF